MTTTVQALDNPRGWLRDPNFDGALIFGVAALALLSGGIVVARPELFPLVLVLDLWFLGYHHVISTFTRLAFDTESFRQHRFLVVWLPFIVLAGAIGLVLVFGGWILSTTYLYWQWFHYTRQSYGIERVYRRKSGEEAVGGERLTRWALYLVPLWGILYRSYQGPETFLGVELRVLPVSLEVVVAAGVVAAAFMAWWLFELGARVLRGGTIQGHSLYLLSHTVVFVTGYIAIQDIDQGWLVLNVWHNAQYILFVWMFNQNRFREGVDPDHRFLSKLSQRSNWPYYFLTCLLISTLIYFGLERGLHALMPYSTLPLFLVAYQTINFHHYIVDGLIWKVRKKPLRQNLGLES
ncbi:MAG: hypothetical protein ACE5GX_02260 [Thermoanaerobaculia bacterium]